MAIGQALQVMAAGIVDTDRVMATIVPGGWALVPPPPVHPSIEQADGGPVLRWVRQTRLAAPWRDAIDTPLDEEREAYRLTLTMADGITRTVELAEARWPIEPADRALSIEVRQIGTHGASAPMPFPYRPETMR